MSVPRSRPSRVATLRRTVRLLFTFLVGLVFVAVAGVAVFVYWELTTNLPDVETLARYQPAMATQVLADDGTVIGEFYLEKRYVVPITRIPPTVRNAFIAAEDDAFYRHGGIDPSGIVRALLNNWMSGDKLQGGSTITQQVVKSLLLSPKKSYERKLKEVILAARLEQQLAKDEILHLYLNHIYLGSGAYGVAAAANEYFGKRIEDLQLAEAALLAGLPQAPSRYSPFKHWPAAKARQRYVLERMVASGFVTRAEADAAAEQPLALASRRGSYVAAPYYVEHVRRWLEERYGETALYSLGLRVHTPVNLRMQQAAETALREGLQELAARQRFGERRRHLTAEEMAEFLEGQRKTMKGSRLLRDRGYDAVVTMVPARPGGPVRVQIGNLRGTLAASPAGNPAYQVGDVVRVRPAPASNGTLEFERAEEPALQGALLAIVPATGDVKAMVGGFDFYDSQFNRAVQSTRQPGSAFKPFIYAAALDRDLTPATIIVDEPISLRDSKGYWMPKNYENRFYGPTTLRDALTFSRNVVTVKLAMRVGLKYLTSYIPRLGVRSPLAPNLSLALGSSEVSLLELATAYGVFADQGQLAEPRFITRITDSQGSVIDENLPRVEQVIAPETAYLITSMLENVIERGTGKRAQALGRPAAGKTGTTNDMNDAWFLGYTPQLLAGVWVGFDEKRSLGKGETGGRVAAPIWARFMEQALENQPILDFPIPHGVNCVLTDKRTGRRAAPGSTGFLECFREGTEPAVAIARRPDPERATEVVSPPSDYTDLD
jgi:penicillin-binding protein 1A